MKDPRNAILAHNLIDYSLALKPGETIYIELKGVATLELGKELIRRATEAGAIPFWYFNDESLWRGWMHGASEEQLSRHSAFHLDIMKKADCYIGVRGSENPFDLADVHPEQMARYQRLYYKPVHLEQRVKKTRWVVLRYPNNAMSQLAERAQEEFEKFYFDVCCLDYGKMSHTMTKLKGLMDKTDRVHLKSPGTDLQFSIKGIGAIKCDGHRNIPDGECFTAPVRDSVNGHISFNCPSLEEGKVYTNVRLEFANGKIVKASADNFTEELNKILDTDEGARFVGEFSLGFNPFILHPMKDTLFDEKIKGSLHFTPGQCYDEAYNGNASAIHWDMVLIQRPEYGGGEVWFDGKLIRKDGVFTDSEIERGFSAENLAVTI